MRTRNVTVPAVTVPRKSRKNWRAYRGTLPAIGVDMLNESNAHVIQIAIDYLQASPAAGGYRYRAHETGSDWVVSADDVARLGRALLDGHEDAYSHWATVSDAVEVAR